MIIGLYFIIKVLVARLLLQPSKSGFIGAAVALNPMTTYNFKIVASVLFYIAIGYTEYITSTSQVNGPGMIEEL